MTDTKNTILDPQGLHPDIESMQAYLQDLHPLNERIQILDTGIDAALADIDNASHTELRQDLNSIALLSGGEVGRLTFRLAQLVDVMDARLAEEQEKLRKETNIVYERIYDDIIFALDDEGNFCFTDGKDPTEQVWVFTARQEAAIRRFFDQQLFTMIKDVVRAIEANDERKAAEAK